MQYRNTQSLFGTVLASQGTKIWSDESDLSKAEGNESSRFSNRFLFRSRAEEPRVAVQDFGMPAKCVLVNDSIHEDRCSCCLRS
jgi:hypothetical protein